MTAVRLKRMGYDIIMCVGAEGEAWCREYQFKHYELDSFEALVRENKDIRGSAEDNGNFKRLMESMGAQITRSFAKELPLLWQMISQDADAVGMLVTSTHHAVAETVARKLGIFSMAVFLTPLTPTKDYAPYLINTRDPVTWQQLPGLENLESWSADLNLSTWEDMLDDMSRDFLPALKFAISTMDAEELFPASDEDKRATLKAIMTLRPTPEDKPLCTPACQTLYAYSDVLVGTDGPSDWSEEQRRRQCGYIFDASGASGAGALSHFSEELRGFLDAGGEPVYFGWGSMCRERNDELVRAAVLACKLLGKRGIILKGWAHLSLDMLDPVTEGDLLDYADSHVLMVDKVNHLRLFPRCACIVAHAGAGTAACMFRSGKPCIITPVWWDQNFMGDRAEVMGCGLRGPHFSKLTGAILAPLIHRVTTEPSFAERAKDVRQAIISKPPGDVVIADLAHQSISEKQALISSHARKLRSAASPATPTHLNGGA
eukprot:CAMPEP_0179023504 /NCGR_PEP_ID=MMETSP0796-20121207/6966_1 /TAXON_ID=73915 /ORGANISM="Pyrodinium bahamense, Strain pbaha01" /LENGTH=487 /DNA_ID=CAMNT_0020719421 /DNA_START=75 /DNA_END=1538 /DNA_ORIENTATION=+